MTTPVLPNYIPRAVAAEPLTSAKPVVPASTLNTQRPLSKIRATVAADGAVLPIVYGQAQVGGRIFAVDYTSGTWTIGAAFCLGEISGYASLLLNGEAPVSGVTVDYYTGTTSQTANSKLAAKISGYSDTLIYTTPNGNVGVAYVVVQYTNAHYENFPSIVAEIQGKKVWDPTGSPQTTKYSANPALCLADLLSSTIYGGGWTVDDTDLITAANACSELTGIANSPVTGEARRTVGLVIDGVQATEDWVEVLRAYAGCFIVQRGGTVHLVPDRPVTSSPVASYAFTEANVIAKSLRIIKEDSSDVPTVIRLRYTDTTETEWREREVIVKADGVDAGTTEWRESVVSMTGVTRYTQAYREAVERLNKATLSDLKVEWSSFDECLQLEPGDVVSMTHYLGLSSKLLRLIEPPVQTAPGRWKLVGVEYDPAVYSDSVQTDPTFTDGSLPPQGPPTAVTGLTLTEVNYQTANGEYASRVKVSWTAHSNAFVTGYQVEVTQGGSVVYSTTTRLTETSTPALKELLTYTVNVRALTALYQGDAASSTIGIVGKYAVPDGPTNLTGFEIAGEVRLAWLADSSDYDIRRYEIRYGTTGGSWSTATVLNRIDALRYQTRDVPPGDWKFYVNSIDSVGQYGTTPTTKTITVTESNNAIVAGTLTCATGSTSNMYSCTEVRGEGTVYYSATTDTWADAFAGDSPLVAMSTFTSALASYFTPTGTSQWISDVLDVGSELAADWRAEITITDYSGSPAATTEMGLATSNSPPGYTWSQVLSQKTSARYAKLRATSAGIFRIAIPNPTIRSDVIAREETGTGTTTGSPIKATVTLTNNYAQLKHISVIPSGTAPRYATYANVQLSTGSPQTSTFDVYVFDSAGNRVSGAFSYFFQGV